MPKAKRYRIVQKRRKRPMVPVIAFCIGVGAISIVAIVVLLRMEGPTHDIPIQADKSSLDEVPIVDGKDADWVTARYQTRKDLGAAMPPRPTLEDCSRNRITFQIYTRAWDRVWGKEAAAQAAAEAKAAVRNNQTAGNATSDTAMTVEQRQLADRRAKYREYVNFYMRMKVNFPNTIPDPPKDDGMEQVAFELRTLAYIQVFGNEKIKASQQRDTKTPTANANATANATTKPSDAAVGSTGP